MAANQSQTFEESMLRLEQIAKRLEDGSIPLEEAIRLFQEGTALAASCGKLLDRAELEITKLTLGPDGQIMEAPYEHKDIE